MIESDSGDGDISNCAIVNRRSLASVGMLLLSLTGNDSFHLLWARNNRKGAIR